VSSVPVFSVLVNRPQNCEESLLVDNVAAAFRACYYGASGDFVDEG